MIMKFTGKDQELGVWRKDEKFATSNRQTRTGLNERMSEKGEGSQDSPSVSKDV